MADDKEDRRWGFHLVFQWGEWTWNRSKMNWQNFEFVHIAVEREGYIASNCWEITFVIFGVGFVFTYTGGPFSNEFARSMAEADQIQAGFRDGLTPAQMGLKRLCPECLQFVDCDDTNPNNAEGE